MKKVLLFEDDPTMMELLTTLLGIEGYQVTHFEGFTEESLFNKLRAEKPDILLMDVHLRQANGLNFLRALRLNPDFQDLRVIMTSGMNLRDNCLDSGANAFIMKPFMPEELITALQNQFSN